MGRPRLTVIPGGRSGSSSRPAGRGAAPAPPQSRIPAFLRRGSTPRGTGPAPRRMGSPRMWGWVFAVAIMAGIALAWFWGDVLSGIGLVCIGVAGILVPPGTATEPGARLPRAAQGLSATGVVLMIVDLALTI